MKPYVLEVGDFSSRSKKQKFVNIFKYKVNHSPSFTTDSRLDREIKDALIYDTIMLINIGAMDKRKCIEEERKKVRERLFLKMGKKETKLVLRNKNMYVKNLLYKIKFIFQI